MQTAICMRNLRIIFNLFSIVGGVALTLLCYLHGMNYIAFKKTEGPIRERARNYAEILYGVFICRFSCFFAVLMYFKTDFL